MGRRCTAPIHAMTMIQKWKHLLESLRLLLANDIGQRTGQLSLQVISEHRQVLDQFAKGRSWALRFPAPLEAEFKGYCREQAKLARAATALLTALLFITAPAWTPALLQLPEATRQFTLYISVILLTPLFVSVAVAILLKPRNTLVEALFMAAFLVEVAAIEFLRARAESNGYSVIAVISVGVPLAILALGRLSALRSLVFVLLYAVLLGLSASLSPWPEGPQAETAILTLAVVLTIALVATGFSQRTRRQTWALIQLMQLGAQVDFLTGLPNRSALERHVEKWIRASSRESKIYSIAVIDLDYFKRINDRYGHQYGDGVLNEAALTIASFARRPGDLAARVGGEEFVLFLYDCDPGCTHARLEQLRTGIEALDIENIDSPFGRLTASIGATTVQHPEAISASYEKADQLLYGAKRAGRNRVALA